MKTRVIAVIPARGGSKGLKMKNILPLGDKPLIAWSIEAALQSSLVDEVVVTTDSEEIAEVAKKFGATVPFMRPKELSDDRALTEDVLKHAIDWYEANEKRQFDILVYLQATDPFRNKGIVNRVTQTLVDNKELESVFAAHPEHKNYWIKDAANFKRIGHEGYLPRQVKPVTFREDTGIALATRTDLIKKGLRVGKKVEIIAHENPGSFVDIHTEFDLWLANQLIKERGIIPNS